MSAPKTRPARVAAAVTVAASTAALLAGCGASTAAAGGTEKLAVVASTNVYGNIVKTIGGDAVEVTSVLSNPDQDPHSFEADPRTALAISRADLLVENGGGYDDYMQKLRSSTRSSTPAIDVVALSGRTAPAGGELNEHVWYDFPTMKRLADDLTRRLSRADPDDAAAFSSRATTFKQALDALIAREAAAEKIDQGKAIGITEPVPLYLTSAMGLVDKTPTKFSEAVEEGDDVAPQVLQETLDLYRDHTVDALVYNEQTSGPVTEAVARAAKAAGVAVVPVTETLPRGETYLSWMSSNVSAVAAAVR